MRLAWATADVSPSRPVALRGQFCTRISRFIGDPVTVTALALESGGDQAVMVSCDRTGIPTPILQRICDEIAARLPDFDASKLFLCATHTHTAPEIEEGFYPVDDPAVMTPTEYAAFFIERTADVIVRAWQARDDAAVSWAFAHAVVGHNRRVSYADGSATMYGSTDRPDFMSFDGYEDHGVDLLFTYDPGHHLTGIVVNLACPSQVSESEYYVSADFWHEVREELRRRHGADLFVLAQCGAAGDQSPHLLMNHRPEAEILRRSGCSEREEIARRIAEAVTGALDGAAGALEADPAFRHLVRTLDLPIRLVTEAEFRKATADLDALEQSNPDPADVNATSYRYIISNRCRDVIDRYRRLQPGTTEPVEVHALRVGDIALATNPFELFLDYGLRIKARSRAVQTFIVQLTASRPAEVAGYLPTARALAGGGYGAEIPDGIFGPVAGQALVEGTLAMIDEMWPSQEETP